MAGNTVTVTDASFANDVLGSDKPVLVDFWAEWCGPCKMVAPVLEEIAGDSEGKLRVGKINVDENLELARRFEVMSIPTLILFKGGQVAAQKVGALSKSQLTAFIDSHL